MNNLHMKKVTTIYIIVYLSVQYWICDIDTAPQNYFLYGL